MEGNTTNARKATSERETHAGTRSRPRPAETPPHGPRPQRERETPGAGNPTGTETAGGGASSLGRHGQGGPPRGAPRPGHRLEVRDNKVTFTPPGEGAGGSNTTLVVTGCRCRC